MQLGDVDVTDPGLDVIVQRSRSRWSGRSRASQAQTWRKAAAVMERAGRRWPATEETAAKKAEASEQADGGSQR